MENRQLNTIETNAINNFFSLIFIFFCFFGGRKNTCEKNEQNITTMLTYFFLWSIDVCVVLLFPEGEKRNIYTPFNSNSWPRINLFYFIVFSRFFLCLNLIESWQCLLRDWNYNVFQRMEQSNDIKKMTFNQYGRWLMLALYSLFTNVHDRGQGCIVLNFEISVF